MKVKFYDVKSRKSIMIDIKATKPQIRKGRKFLTAKSPASGIIMWRIMGKAK